MGFRLVALHHIPNSENKPQVNHKDGKRKDVNAVSNLEWATQSENMQHSYQKGLRQRWISTLFVRIRSCASASVAKLDTTLQLA